ncbi:MAG: glycosyltransferase [Christensenellales bacterium]
MKIVYVVDQFDSHNNGTSVSAARFVNCLRERGHEVRVVSTGRAGPYKYVVRAKKSLLNPIFKSHGMVFGVPDKSVIKKAFEGADVVHLHLPFKLCLKARKIADEMNIPYMAAFHCQPENISFNMGIRGRWLPSILYRRFRRRFYRYIRDIHCPSGFIAKQLLKHRYAAKMHIISNGISYAFHPIDTKKPSEWEDKFVILMAGRLAPEKRQDIVIKAALKSKHSDKIQLVFLGKGPLKNRYERVGRKLKNRPVFKYVDQYKMALAYNQADLYVHAAEAEIESIVCLEAIATGLVPVISDSDRSAAKQFAIDKRSLFSNNSAADLAAKIDYWIENTSERARMGKLYLAKAGEYSIDKSIDKIEAVYKGVVAEHRKGAFNPDDPHSHALHMPTPYVCRVDARYRFINRNIFFRIGSWLLFYIIAIPLLDIVSMLFFGLKIHGKKNLRFLKSGAVTVTNHVHYLDSPMVACTLFPRKPLFATLKNNLEIPVIRRIIRLLGGVPIPESPKALHAFMESMRTQLLKGRIVHFYPEASLWPWHNKLRPFKNGAFHLAVKSGVPVVPMVFTFRNSKGLLSKLRKKPLVDLNIGKPEYPAKSGTERSKMLEMRTAVHNAMEAMLESKHKESVS